jgi:hypothetical protein
VNGKFSLRKIMKDSSIELKDDDDLSDFVPDEGQVDLNGLNTINQNLNKKFMKETEDSKWRKQ